MPIDHLLALRLVHQIDEPRTSQLFIFFIWVPDVLFSAAAGFPCVVPQQLHMHQILDSCFDSRHSPLTGADGWEWFEMRNIRNMYQFSSGLSGGMPALCATKQPGDVRKTMRQSLSNQKVFVKFLEFHSNSWLP